MKQLLLFLSAIFATAVFAAEEKKDSSLLFYASYDSYSANADFAKGHKHTATASLRDLQLRMHAGVAGKGNALELSNRESASYFAPGNIDPRQGTVMLWAASKNWAPSNAKFQIFFHARLTGGWRLLIYKFIKPGYIRTALIYKNKEYAINIPVKDVDWSPGKWHQLAVTWDNTRITFYMDGKKARQVQYTKNPLTFKAADFPAKIEKCNFVIGAGGIGFSVNPEHKTAIDEVKIYNRMISPDEIRKEYEKFFPPQTGAADRPIVSVPNGSAINLDGKIDKKEWADASVVPVINLLQKGVQNYGPFTRVYLKQDAANYYFAAEVMEKAGRSVVTGDDNVDIWRDDCVELHFFSPQNKHYYQYIINPRGALFDSFQTPKDSQMYSYVPGGNMAYQSKAKKAVFNGEKSWSVELVIPKKSMKFGKEIWANFCRTNYGAKSFVTWAPGCQSYFHMEKFGKLVMGGKPGRLENFAFQDGSCKVDFNGRDICIYNNDHSRLNFTDGKLELPAGLFRLESKGKNWNYVFPFFIKKDFDFSYSSLHSKKSIEVKINLSSASKNVRDQLTKGLPVIVTLEKQDGSILTQNKVIVKKAEDTVTLPLPRNPVRSICNIRVAFSAGKEKVNAIKKFRVPDMTPFLKKVADDHAIPTPWTAIKQQSNGKFEMLSKTVAFGKGPFPTAAAIDGKPVFKSAPVMILNGKNIAWGPAVVKENTGDRVIFEGTGKTEGFTFRYRSELWFDGMVKTDIFMDGKKAINSLKMNWKVPASQAQYLLNPLFTKWQGKDGEKLSLPYSFGQDFMLWTMGLKEGLCFHPQSQANFFNARNHKNYTISRKGDTVSIDVDIISKKAMLQKTAKYTFVFMPTPAKPFDPKWRDLNYGDLWGYQKHETFKVNGFGVNKIAQPYDLEPWTGLVPAFPEKFAKYAKDQLKKGSSFVPYSQPCYMGEIEEAYDWFFPECETKPDHLAGTAWSHKEKRLYNSPAVCGDTELSHLFVYRADKILTDYPDLSGLYYDICQGNICYNTRHGHGGVDAFGQEYADSNLLSLRSFFLRIRKVVKKHNKLLILHAHNRFSPFTHAFGDAWFPGEQYVVNVHQNPHHFYCDGIPLREYQSAYSSQTHGCAMILFSQLRRQIWVYKTRNYADDVHTMMYLTPVMLHDINTAVTESKPALIGKVWSIRHDMKLSDAVFHGYWFDKTYTVNVPGVYVSWYELKNAPYRRMIVIGNIGKKAHTVKLEGLGADKLYDLWNGHAPQDGIAIKIGKETFRVFGLK